MDMAIGSYVTANKRLLAVTITANKRLLAVTITANKRLLAVTLSNNFVLFYPKMISFWYFTFHYFDVSIHEFAFHDD